MLLIGRIVMRKFRFYAKSIVSMKPISRIAVVGNSGGGKTTLSRSLSQIHQSPLTHVDTIQFLPGMVIRPLDETRKTLREITNHEKWLIDGFGPLDLIEERFQLADRIVFVDFPIWRHYWWSTKRQIKSLWTSRSELPEGCDEATIAHTIKLFKILWRVHKKMRPEVLKIFARESLKHKMVFIRNMKEWNQIYNKGLPLRES
jgi:adenylate kinase family enzyme